MLAVLARSAILLAILGLFVINTFGQRVSPERPTGPLTLYGDLKVNEADADASRPLSYTVLLYSDGGILVSRLNIANGGRYRFLNLPPAVYDLAVEVDNAEVARVRVELLSTRVGDIRQDLELEWRRPAAANPGKVINASATYSRSPANQKLFDSGRKEIDNKRFDEGIALLKTLVKSDRKDFQAWLELGTAYLFKQDFDAAEDAYLHAVDTKSDFLLALMNLGRLYLMRNRADAAIDVFGRAVTLQPKSAEANYYLGDAYLQAKKGSLAVDYLNKALQLEPAKMAEAHLRLAALYNAVGMKDKAAAEYEQFLKKRPDYKERKALEQYISQNKKS